MPVTVADLLADPGLGLRLRTPDAPVARPVSWVHVSELADPTPFLEGGELLLTTGLGPRDGAPAADYVARLVAAGVVGLGYGTGVGSDAVPGELAAAAAEQGLAVLEVPRRTPFIALSRAVSAALAADEYAAVARAARASQELTRAATAPGAPAALLDRLARAVGGWALLADAAGAVLGAAPPGAAARAAGLQPDLDRLRAVRPPAGAALSGPGETVLVQSLGSGSRVRGFLAVGRCGALAPAERHVVTAAGSLLTLRLEQTRALDSGLAALRAALLRLLLAGEDDAADRVAGALGAPLPAGPLAVLLVLGGPGQRAAAVDVATDAADAADAAGEPLLCAEDGDALVLLVPAGGALAAALDRLPERVPGAVLGVAAPVARGRLADGVAQARQAAEHARARGVRRTAFADLSAGLGALVDPGAARAWSAAVLAPVAAADRAGPGDLVASLRVWLAHHGQWEPAAAQLAVHRHTLRKRVRRAGELLGRDLDDPGVRAELWLALHPPAAGRDTGQETVVDN